MKSNSQKTLKIKKMSPHSITKSIIIGVLFLSIYLLNFMGSSYNNINLRVGDVCEDNIVAPFTIHDISMTESLRQQASDMTSPVYDYVSNVQINALNSVEKLENIVNDVHTVNITNESVVAYNTITQLDLTLNDYIYLSKISIQEKTLLFASLKQLISNVYSTQIKSTEVTTVRANTINELNTFKLENDTKSLAIKVIKKIIQPNMLYNVEATEVAQKSARDSISDVVYQSGQTIIPKGQKVTEHDIDLLKDNRLMKLNIFDSFSTSFGTSFFIIILLIIFIIYLYAYHSDIFSSNKQFCILMLIFISVLALAQISNRYSIYAVPVGILTMTLCIIFNARIAVQTNLFLMLFLSFILKLDTNSFIFLCVSGYSAIIYSNKILTRLDILKSGLAISVINSLTVLAFTIIQNSFTQQFIFNIIYAFANGLICAFISSAHLLILEKIFNIVTPFKLLEMTNLNDISIQQLINKAPGTYYHTLVVGNLSYMACKAISANALLARVGAHYHDIGKSEKAMYFKENQEDGNNPHDYISPEVSARIIKNHVSDGIYFANKHNIPAEITEFIITHHGTSEITYFKNVAIQENYTGDEDFHYAGRLPVSKETTVVMLADSVEAAVRSLDIQDPDSIHKMINTIFNKKIAENQLVESEISMKELEIIKKTFADVLMSVHHSRISYNIKDKK